MFTSVRRRYSTAAKLTILQETCGTATMVDIVSA